MSQEQVQSLIDQGRGQEAAELLNEHLLNNPDDPGALHTMAQLLSDARKPAISLAIMQKLVMQYPDNEDFWATLATIEGQLQRYPHAEAAATEALKLDDANNAALRAMAHAKVGQYEFETADEYATRALDDKEHQQSRVARAFADLHRRNWARGWKDYHHGLGHMQWRDKHDYGLPEYAGKGSVLVYAEQGIGDQLVYCGSLREVECTQLNVNPKLKNVLQRSFPEIDVQGRQFKPGAFPVNADTAINMAGLMMYTRSDPERFPNEPYLIPHEEKMAQWRALLPEGINIGIAWTGGTPGSSGWQTRCIDPARFLPLSEIGNLISLEYKTPDLEGFEDKWGVKIHHWSWATETDDLDDSVALQACLDAVVCVPTTAYHIAGALGQECHVIVHDRPHFHEGVTGDSSPWWDSVRLHRRPEKKLSGCIKAIREILCESLSVSTQDSPSPTTYYSGPSHDEQASQSA